LSLMVNFAIVFLLIGLYLLVKKDKKTLWGGIVCILISIGLWYATSNWETNKNLIGIHVVKNTSQEYLIEMRYFNLKADAISYYQKHNISDFSLVSRFDGDTKNFFRMIGNNTAKIKRLKFEADSSQKRTAIQEYQDFFVKYKLIPAYSSKKPE
jgi:hypothetical protein